MRLKPFKPCSRRFAILLRGLLMAKREGGASARLQDRYEEARFALTLSPSAAC